MRWCSVRQKFRWDEKRCAVVILQLEGRGGRLVWRWARNYSAHLFAPLDVAAMTRLRRRTRWRMLQMWTTRGTTVLKDDVSSNFLSDSKSVGNVVLFEWRQKSGRWSLGPVTYFNTLNRDCSYLVFKTWEILTVGPLSDLTKRPTCWNIFWECLFRCRNNRYVQKGDSLVGRAIKT